VHKQLEAEADELIFGSLEGVTSREAKSDILTPWKDKHRKVHEVLVRSGSPDPSVRRGIFVRAYNSAQPHLNSYDGPTRPIRMNEQFDPDLVEGQGGTPNLLSPAMAAAVGVERAD